MSLSPSEEHALARLPKIFWRAAPLSPTEILLKFGRLPTPVTFELPEYPSVRYQLYTTPHNDLVQGLFPDYLISASLLSLRDTTTLDSSCDLIQHLLSRLPNHYNQGQWTCHFLEDPNPWRFPQHGCLRLAEFLTQVTLACVAATGGTCSDMRIWKCHETEDSITDIIVCIDATFKNSNPDWKIAHAAVILVSKYDDIYSTAASQATRIFTTQDTRRWVIVVIMCSTTFTPFLFDRGGSIQGASMNIHTEAHTFLQLILGLTFIPSQYQGYDTTIVGQGPSHSMLSGSPYGNLLIQIILSQSSKMYGQGSVVRLLKLTSAQLHQLFSDVHPDTIKWLKGLDPNAREIGIIMKDAWHDQYSTFTEGTILTLLRDKGVRGVPRLLFEYMVPPPDAPSLVISGSGKDAKTFRSTSCDHTAYIRARAGLTYYPPMDCEFHWKRWCFPAPCPCSVRHTPLCLFHRRVFIPIRVVHGDD
ncbi:hypothetical protein L210DRAFT_2378070 [Boletus edulis BED1]|uniref:Fungal-type protein kinase domain-containing protein n=1 Tax=Boletus edulis BED1 TaxID=1328754 RepID=A0AAD4C663_BOLED|nr:hypothetical protein L210DRAFT_2378070 [Boletus edulis BED1]